MALSLLQLNIEEGKRSEEIIPYVKQHDFDILHFQEVTGGEHNARGFDIFPVLKEALGYEAIQAVYWRLADDPATYMSNVTFFKPTLMPLSSEVIFLKPYKDLSREELHTYADHPTCALDVVFRMDELQIHFINTHLVWGPTPEDKPYKVEQGKVLYDYVRRLNEPFVLSGDFNVIGDSQIVKWMDELGVNHAKKAGVANTLNPATHRVKHLFPPGLAVDFLYTHPSLQVQHFQLVDTPDLSDHFGLSIEIVG